MNILFTCVGRRHYLIEYFQKVKPEGSFIVGADMQSTAPAMAIVDKNYIVPALYDHNYIERLLEICKKEKIGAIISLNDLELPLLSNFKNEFNAIGVQVIVSDKRVIDICFDKWRTIEFATKIGIKTPKTYLNLSSALMGIEKGEINYPLIIKPRWGSGSFGIEIATDMEELNLSYKLLEKKLFRSLLSEVSKKDMENAILIQEKIEGTEYGVDIFNNLRGENLSVYIKEKLAMRAGETDKAVLRNHKAIENICKTISENLCHIGNLDCDIFESNDGYYLLEMNPRFGGGYPFSHKSGANFPAVIYALLHNEEIQSEWFKKDYDKIYSKCDILISVN